MVAYFQLALARLPEVALAHADLITALSALDADDLAATPRIYEIYYRLPPDLELLVFQYGLVIARHLTPGGLFHLGKHRLNHRASLGGALLQSLRFH